MSSVMRKLALALALIMVFGMVPNVHAASPQARAIDIFRIDGTDVTLARSFGGRQVAPRAGQRLSEGNEITTRWDTQVYFSLDADSIIKMDESTQVVVGSARERLVLTVQSGAVLVAVVDQAAHHSLETRIGNTVIGVRGTHYFMRRLADDVVTITMLSGLGVVDFVDEFGRVTSVPLNMGYMMQVFDRHDPAAAAGVVVGFQSYVLMPIDFSLLTLFELVEMLALLPDLEYELQPYIDRRITEREAQRQLVLEREARNQIGRIAHFE